MGGHVHGIGLCTGSREGHGRLECSAKFFDDAPKSTRRIQPNKRHLATQRHQVETFSDLCTAPSIENSML